MSDFTIIDEIRSKYDEKYVECYVCKNKFNESFFLDLICNHKLCFNCSEKIINRYGDNKCPLCRINLYDTRSIISSYNNLSRYYLKIGIELTKKNKHIEAIDFFKKSYNLNSVESIYYLGICFLKISEKRKRYCLYNRFLI